MLLSLLIGVWFAVMCKNEEHLSSYETIAMVAKSSTDMLVQSPLERAREITDEIKNAASIERLLCTYHAHQHMLDHIHLSACWS